MRKAIQILVILAVICALGCLLAWGTALISGAVLFSRGLNSLADLMHMPGWVKSVTFWALLVPFSFLFAQTFSPFRKSRWCSTTFLIGTAIAYWSVAAILNYHRYFDPVTGQPLKWADVDPYGRVYLSDRPGVDPKTGRPWIPVTPSLVQKFYAPQNIPSVPQKTDPKSNAWFSPYTGEALLFYYHPSTNDSWEFFKGTPGMFDEQTGSQLLPVTHAVQQEWQSDMKRQQAEAAAREAKRIAEEEEAAKKAAAEESAHEMQRQEATKKAAAEEAARKAKEEEAAKEAEAQAQQAAAKQQEEEQRQAVEDAVRARQQFIESRRADEAVAPVTSLVWLKPENFLDQCFQQFDVQAYQTNIFDSEFLHRRMRYAGQVKNVIKKSNLAIFEFQTISGIHLSVQAKLQPGMAQKLRVGKITTVAGTICDWRLLPGNTQVEGIDGQGMILDLSDVEVVPEEIKPIASNKTCTSCPVLETAVSTVLLPVRLGLSVIFGDQNASVAPTTYVVSAPPCPTYYGNSWPSVQPNQPRYYYQSRNVQATYYYARPVVQTRYVSMPPSPTFFRQSPIYRNR
jgi:hypothetical protein